MSGNSLKKYTFLKLVTKKNDVFVCIIFLSDYFRHTPDYKLIAFLLIHKRCCGNSSLFWFRYYPFFIMLQWTIPLLLCFLKELLSHFVLLSLETKMNTRFNWWDTKFIYIFFFLARCSVILSSCSFNLQHVWQKLDLHLEYHMREQFQSRNRAQLHITDIRTDGISKFALEGF